MVSLRPAVAVLAVSFCEVITEFAVWSFILKQPQETHMTSLYAKYNFGDTFVKITPASSYRCSRLD